MLRSDIHAHEAQNVKSVPIARRGLTKKERRKVEDSSQDMFKTHIAVFKHVSSETEWEEQKTCIALGIVKQWLCYAHQQNRREEKN